MIRIIVFLAILAAAAFGFAWLADRPGQIVLTWQGYRIETSLMVALGAIAALTIALIVLWSLLRFILRIPAIMSITARARRNNKGYAAVSKGMVAAAIGDAKTTEKAAREASKHLGAVPLTSLLQAQAAQISGDRDKAIAAFNQMLDDPDTKVLGLRGLYLEARRNGDSAAAQAFAREAYGLAALPWAGQALLEQHVMSDDWAGALAVVENSVARKTIAKAAGNRQRGVLKTAIAMNLAEREPDEALRIAREAMKLAPDLIPAYVAAGRLLARKGDIRRAGRILEDAWRVKPHPEIARAYIDLRPGDSSQDRLARAKTLVKVHADDPESRLTLARAALEARDFDLARKTMEPLFADRAPRATVRMCLLMADLEETQYGETGKVREWLARATRAARDPMWIADGIVTDTWSPASPVSGKLDAFVWDVPVERLSAPEEPAKKDEELPTFILPPKDPPAESAAPSKTAADAAPVEKPEAKPDPAKLDDGKTIEMAPVKPAAEKAPETAAPAASAALKADAMPAAAPEPAAKSIAAKDAGKQTGKETGAIAPTAETRADAPKAATAVTPAAAPAPAAPAAKPDAGKPAETTPAAKPAASDNAGNASAKSEIRPATTAPAAEKPAPVLTGPPDDPGPRK
ncbi:MAG: heme biosynthesis protein HemY [Beijerinckiaceae bacterium]